MAVEVTGKFIKYYVKAYECSNQVQQPQETETETINAFEVMMSASAMPTHPPMTSARNSKDRLYNDILLYVQSRSLAWDCSEVRSGIAARCLTTLRDALWYIDGMHDTLNERSCNVPAVFDQFGGYNTPQQHKHRKRMCHSMSRDELLSISRSLFGCLASRFWSQLAWFQLKKDVEQLARSLASYADLLLDKRQVIHSSKEVPRNIGDNLSVSYIDVCDNPSPILSA